MNFSKLIPEVRQALTSYVEFSAHVSKADPTGSYFHLNLSAGTCTVPTALSTLKSYLLLVRTYLHRLMHKLIPCRECQLTNLLGSNARPSLKDNKEHFGPSIPVKFIDGNFGVSPFALALASNWRTGEQWQLLMDEQKRMRSCDEKLNRLYRELLRAHNRLEFLKRSGLMQKLENLQ